MTTFSDRYDSLPRKTTYEYDAQDMHMVRLVRKRIYSLASADALRKNRVIWTLHDELDGIDRFRETRQLPKVHHLRTRFHTGGRKNTWIKDGSYWCRYTVVMR